MVGCMVYMLSIVLASQVVSNVLSQEIRVELVGMTGFKFIFGDDCMGGPVCSYL